MVSPQSIEAYHSILADGTKYKQRDKILKAIETCGTMTRRELGQVTGLELGAVSGRVNKLIEDEILEEVGTTTCKTTKKTVALIGFPLGQKELFQ